MDCPTLQQRHQESMSSQSLDSMITCTKPQNEQQEKKPRPADEHALKCPRCDSANTKFCYYNNYSLSQPRYFCKSCRRYWTKGGILRNVPVGGGCRKNRRSSSSSKKTTPDDHHLQVPELCITNPTSYDHTGLTLAHGNVSLLGNHGNAQFDLFGNLSGNSFLNTLRSGLIESNPSVYYGNLGDVENGGGNSSVNLSHEDSHEIAMQFDNNHIRYNCNPEVMSNASSGSSTPTAVKQELGENGILWGFPWQQLSGSEGNYMNNNAAGNTVIDSFREGWNSAIVGSSWNNLLNSPLI